MNKHKMNIALMLSILSIIISLSGWATFLYNYFTSKPKIKGKILQLMTCEWHNPLFLKPKTGIFVYLYLINQRKYSVTILDYELEINTGNGYEKVARVYGTQDIDNPTFQSDEYEITIPNFNDKLIYSKKSLLEYGLPLHGFALFASDRPHNEVIDKIINLKVTYIDAFNKRHVIRASPKDFTNLIFLQDIAGIKIKQKILK